MFALNLLAVPNRCHAGDRIEIFDVIDSGNHLVMVTADKNSSQRPRAFCYFVGTGAVPDNVAEVNGCITRRNRRKTSFKSFQITVNVADEKYAQYLPDFVSFGGLCQKRIIKRAPD